jgi:hypothetical protein
MKERAAAIFPFAIAVVLPPAGLFIGLAALDTDRDLGIRLMVVSVLAAIVWTLLILSRS